MRLQLAHEGITVPDDFIDFDAEGLGGIFLNLLKPPKVPAAGAAALAAGRLCEIMAYEVSAKSKMHLKDAQKIAKFYENVGRDLDPQNMTWLVIKCFLEQWKALMERKKEDFGLPPKLTKHYPVHKWMELMVLYLGQKVGVRNAPLAYVVRAKKVKVAYLYAITHTRNFWPLTKTRETSCPNGRRPTGARRKVVANK
jgi:hypothetical protein